MKEHVVTSMNNFIGGWTPDDTTLCDKLIDYFKSNKSYEGNIWREGQNQLNKKHKDCLTVDLIGNFKRQYIEYLYQSTQKYIDKYKNCDLLVDRWGVTEGIGLQYYKPTAGFHGWHCERSSKYQPVGSRHLVFMTYLNDVTDGGETEFYYQDIKVKPEKGLTLIWPSDWTHTHRGITSLTQEKYIVTGWYNII